ncbi:MAG: menE [Acidimicrobiaceae bacterium]|nr:menE [Acidimicrobiaceae bacterium]
MPRLVAIDLPGGPAFLEALRRVLDAGDAALPIDQRLPSVQRERLVAALRPSAVIDASGDEQELAGGLEVEPGDALVVATSGTTGAPKGVVLTRASVEASAWATSARLEVDPSRDRWCCCLPLAHVGGLSVLTRSIVTGTPVEVLPRFDAEAVLAAARERGATLVSLVPTTLRRLGDDGAASYRCVVLGGSAPPERLASNVVATYGMTETGSGVVYDGVPLEGVEVRLGPHDEIELRGPMLLRAYRDGTDPKGPGGWLATGDAGAIGADGTLSLYGRIGDLVVSGGENVWPEQVEQVLSHHRAVAEVGVAGIADPEWGERVVAYVVPAPDVPPPSLDELRELALGELGPWSAPRELVLVGDLPRTSIGKLRRNVLAQLARSGRIVP